MSRKLRSILAALGILGAMSGAAIAQSVIETRQGALRLPEYIGPLEYLGERTAPDIGVPGATYSYRAVGLSLDIRVYDYGPDALPDGIDSPRLIQAYEQAKRGMRLSSEGVVPLARNAAYRVREAVFACDDDASCHHSYVWLTGIHGLMLDVRFEVAPGFDTEGEISREEILAALGEAIPPAESVRRARRASAAEAGATPTDVALLLDPATPEEERPLWVTYLYARAAHAVQELGEQPPVPGERVASFEEEVRARLVAVNVYRSLRRQNDGPASEYFSDLDRVESAGFLREYVWRYLHQRSWTAEPDGLALEAFDAWRAVHLVDHIAVTHGRIAFRQRTS